jgi:hypothetical protein
MEISSECVSLCYYPINKCWGLLEQIKVLKALVLPRSLNSPAVFTVGFSRLKV